MKKVFIGLLLTLTLGTYTIKDFKEDRTNEIQEVKAQTIEEIEKYQKQKRTIPLSSEQQEELEKIKKEKEIAIEKEKTKKVNDEFSKDLDNIENKINNLDFNYENPFDKLSEDDQVRLTKENKDRLNNLIEKSKINKENLAKLQKEPSQKDNTDYQNSKLNEIRDNNNKKVEEKIRQENKRKQEEQKKKEEQARKEKEQNKKEEEKRQEKVKSIEKHPYSLIINNETWDIIDGDQAEIDEHAENTWINVTGSWGDHYAIYNNNDDKGMYLAAHRDIGEIIENVDEFTYIDPDGVEAKYHYVGVTDYIQGGYVPTIYYDEDGNYEDSDVSYVPFCMGIAGKYIVFQTCIDYSNSHIALGWVFEKE